MREFPTPVIPDQAREGYIGSAREKMTRFATKWLGGFLPVGEHEVCQF